MTDLVIIVNANLALWMGFILLAGKVFGYFSHVPWFVPLWTLGGTIIIVFAWGFLERYLPPVDDNAPPADGTPS